MAPNPSDSGSAAAIRTPTRMATRQACDGCRFRKRKCTFRNAGSIHWTNVVQASESTERCDNCERADRPCTFLLPFKTRGPKRKTGQQYTIGHWVFLEHRLDWQAHKFNGQSPISQQSVRSPSPVTESTASLPRSFDGIASSATCERSYPTDVLFPRDLVRFILRDYVTYVYPVIPVIHRPTFEADFTGDRDAHDQEFLSLIISLCAITVGLLPSRFQIYREYEPPLPFQTRTEMANHCYKLNQSFRDTTYFDTVNHQKWASTYLLALAFHQIGNSNLWRMLEVEAMQVIRLLEVHHIVSYAGLDVIEAQLRKKAFWLMFYDYIHQLHNLRNERIMYLDHVILRDIKLEDLMPAPLDDEYITSNGIATCPEDVAANSLTAGFNIHSRIFAAALEAPGVLFNFPCSCARPQESQSQDTNVKEQLHHLKHMLDTLPPAYRPWNKKATLIESTPEHKDVGDVQREAIRVNIHVTHLWLQSIMLDRIDAIAEEQQLLAFSPHGSGDRLALGSGSSPSLQSIAPHSTSWDKREDICRQLLYSLHSFAHSALEPNGLSLVYKVRDVAVPLLACPDGRERRAKEYLSEFASLLSVLDVNQKANSLILQSWIDTSRDKSITSLPTQD